MLHHPGCSTADATGLQIGPWSEPIAAFFVLMSDLASNSSAGREDLARHKQDVMTVEEDGSLRGWMTVLGGYEFSYAAEPHPHILVS